MRAYLNIFMASGMLIISHPLIGACPGGSCPRNIPQEGQTNENCEQDSDDETPDEEAACYYYFYDADLESTWYDEPVNSWPSQHEDSWYDYFTK